MATPTPRIQIAPQVLLYVTQNGGSPTPPPNGLPCCGQSVAKSQALTLLASSQPSPDALSRDFAALPKAHQHIALSLHQKRLLARQEHTQSARALAIALAHFARLCGESATPSQAALPSYPDAAAQSILQRALGFLESVPQALYADREWGPLLSGLLEIVSLLRNEAGSSLQEPLRLGTSPLPDLPIRERMQELLREVAEGSKRLSSKTIASWIQERTHALLSSLEPQKHPEEQPTAPQKNAEASHSKPPSDPPLVRATKLIDAVLACTPRSALESRFNVWRALVCLGEEIRLASRPPCETSCQEQEPLAPEERREAIERILHLVEEGTTAQFILEEAQKVRERIHEAGEVRRPSEAAVSAVRAAAPEEQPDSLLRQALNLIDQFLDSTPAYELGHDHDYPFGGVIQILRYDILKRLGLPSREIVNPLGSLPPAKRKEALCNALRLIYKFSIVGEPPGFNSPLLKTAEQLRTCLDDRTLDPPRAAGAAAGGAAATPPRVAPPIFPPGASPLRISLLAQARPMETHVSPPLRTTLLKDRFITCPNSDLALHITPNMSWDDPTMGEGKGILFGEGEGRELRRLPHEFPLRLKDRILLNRDFIITQTPEGNFSSWNLRNGCLDNSPLHFIRRHVEKDAILYCYDEKTVVFRQGEVLCAVTEKRSGEIEKRNFYIRRDEGIEALTLWEREVRFINNVTRELTIWDLDKKTCQPIRLPRAAHYALGPDYYVIYNEEERKMQIFDYDADNCSLRLLRSQSCPELKFIVAGWRVIHGVIGQEGRQLCKWYL